MERERSSSAAKGAPVTALACVFVIGCASLFSWNAVITISSYWRARFCGTWFEGAFESVFACTYQATSLASNVYALSASQSTSVRSRIVPTQKALVVVFGGFAVLALFPRAPKNGVFVPATLLGVAACGSLSQFLCAAVYGTTAALRGGFNAANMAGQAVGGLVPALIVVATIASAGVAKPDAHDADGGDACGAPEVDAGAVGYFVTAACLFGISLLAFELLERQPVFAESSLAAGAPPAGAAGGAAEGGFEAALLGDGGDVQSPSRDSARSGGDVDDAPVCSDLRGFLSLANEIRIPAAAVFLVFACTLAPFPALTALARPEGHADDDGGSGSLFRALYVPLLFLEFNAFDFCGRSAGGWVPSPGAKALLLLAVLRLAFIPMICLGTLSGGESVDGGGVFRSSAAPFAVMAPFALSNGLVATLAMGEAPGMVAPHKREFVGNLMCLFLTLGLTVGSALSFALVAIA